MQKICWIQGNILAAIDCEFKVRNEGGAIIKLVLTKFYSEGSISRKFMTK